MDKYDFSEKYKKLIIESYKEAKFDIDHLTDEEIFDLFESDDEGKFINEWSEKLDPEYYNSDDFDFDLFEEIHEIYTKNWEKIPRIDSSSEYDRLIFRQSLDIGELNKNCKLPWYERRSR